MQDAPRSEIQKEKTPSTSGRNGRARWQVAPTVERIGLGVVNAYMIGKTGEAWVLVDAGLPGASPYIRQAAQRRYGPDARPEAIILTHGHFDHAGAALDLAEEWDVPIYAHPQEMPFLTGTSDYPPKDPTVGGAMATMGRVFPTSGYDFGDRVRTLPQDGSLPAGLMPDWKWLHTPGHTPGHISLFRDTDDVLIAGDALATMNLDSWTAQLTHRRQIDRPPPPFTPDWEAARASVQRLAELAPMTVAAGHGQPMTGPHVADELRRFAEHFRPPLTGRYVHEPVRTDEEQGVVEVPPPADDPLPKVAAGIAAGVLGGAALLALLRR